MLYPLCPPILPFPTVQIRIWSCKISSDIITIPFSVLTMPFLFELYPLEFFGSLFWLFQFLLASARKIVIDHSRIRGLEYQRLLSVLFQHSFHWKSAPCWWSICPELFVSDYYTMLRRLRRLTFPRTFVTSKYFINVIIKILASFVVFDSEIRSFIHPFADLL